MAAFSGASAGQSQISMATPTALKAGPYHLTFDTRPGGGQGASTSRHRAHCLRSGQSYAITAVCGASICVYTQLARQLRMQSRCAGHPGVQRVYALVVVGDCAQSSQYAASLSSLLPVYYIADNEQADVARGWYVLREYCDGGHLLDWLVQSAPQGSLAASASTGGLPAHQHRHAEATVQQLFVQVVEAVVWCHSVGVAHRDIRLEHVLLKRRCQVGADAHPLHINTASTSLFPPFLVDDWEVKLGGFGAATDVQYVSCAGNGAIGIMSPECHPDVDAYLFQTQPCDIWALGILLINLLCRVNPWRRAHPADRQFSRYIARPRRTLRETLGVRCDVNEILLRALHPDPERRCEASELLTLTQYTWVLRRRQPEKAISATSLRQTNSGSGSGSAEMHRRHSHEPRLSKGRTATAVVRASLDTALDISGERGAPCSDRAPSDALHEALSPAVRSRSVHSRLGTGIQRDRAATSMTIERRTSAATSSQELVPILGVPTGRYASYLPPMMLHQLVPLPTISELAEDTLPPAREYRSRSTLPPRAHLVKHRSTVSARFRISKLSPGSVDSSTSTVLVESSPSKHASTPVQPPAIAASNRTLTPDYSGRTAIIASASGDCNSSCSSSVTTATATASDMAPKPTEKRAMTRIGRMCQSIKRRANVLKLIRGSTRRLRRSDRIRVTPSNSRDRTGTDSSAELPMLGKPVSHPGHLL